MIKDGLRGTVLTIALAGFAVNAAQGIKAPHPGLPFEIYTEKDEWVPYAPSGWMGDVKGIELDLGWSKQPHSGKTCIRFRYCGQEWAGIAWQDPPNDWGEDPGGFDLTGARRLVFWARGEEGGEVVDFKIGILHKGPRSTESGEETGLAQKMVLYPDSATASARITLRRMWKKYRIELGGKDLSRIKTGFVWAVKGRVGGCVTFYIDDVRYE